MKSARQRDDDYRQARARMVEQQLRARGVRDERVLAAMLAVPRHEFVAPQERHRAYDDHPLPIGADQTISQPYMVAVMCEALALKGPETVLDVGTGSGYQAAILAHLAQTVYSIERERGLLEAARQTLQHLGVSTVHLVEGDGTQGYAAAAPYDGIVVGAAAPDVPQTLVDQLKETGRLVIPVGDMNDQELLLLRKFGDRLSRSVITHCRFVPLVGAEGWRS